MIIAPWSARAVKRVVVGVDPGVSGVEAMRLAIVVARLLGSELHAVRAWTYPVAWHNAAANRHRRSAAQDDAEQSMAATLDKALGAQPSDANVRTAVTHGDAGHVLSTYCSDVDVLVIGAPRTATFWAFRKNVARQCLNIAERRSLSCRHQPESTNQYWSASSPPSDDVDISLRRLAVAHSHRRGRRHRCSEAVIAQNILQSPLERPFTNPG